MKKLSLLAVILLVISSCTYSASLTSMNKAQVVAMFQNKTITTIPLATMNGGLVTDTLTMYLDKKGQIDGQFASKPANDLQVDRGVWKVNAEGILCASWDHWNQGNKICVAVYDLKNAIVFVNTKTGKFESMVLKENIVAGKKMS